jgi:hypothetical protein
MYDEKDVAHVGDKRNPYSVLFCKHEGKKPRGILRNRLKSKYYNRS